MGEVPNAMAEGTVTACFIVTTGVLPPGSTRVTLWHESALIYTEMADREGSGYAAGSGSGVRASAISTIFRSVFEKVYPATSAECMNETPSVRSGLGFTSST